MKKNKIKIKKTNKQKKNWRYHVTDVYQKPQSGTVPEIWSDTISLSFRASFCPPSAPTQKNFEKKKKASGDVIILNLCNKKHNQMMYAYSDMECDRYKFLSF